MADAVAPVETNGRKVLVVDVGGTSVKVFATGQDEPRKFLSGPEMKPKQMVSGAKQIVKEWKYDVVSIADRGLGKKKWRRYVAYCISRLIDALQPDDVVLGGGNAKELKELPPTCRLGDNGNAFVGGFRLWDDSDHDIQPQKVRSINTR